MDVDKSHESSYLILVAYRQSINTYFPVVLLLVSHIFNITLQPHNREYIRDPYGSKLCLFPSYFLEVNIHS